MDVETSPYIVLYPNIVEFFRRGDMETLSSPPQETSFLAPKRREATKHPI